MELGLGLGLGLGPVLVLGSESGQGSGLGLVLRGAYLCSRVGAPSRSAVMASVTPATCVSVRWACDGTLKLKKLILQRRAA